MSGASEGPRVHAPLLVVIDGPAGAGKTTVAARLARHFGLPLLDTGAIYRCVALLAHEQGVDWGDAAAVAALARGLELRFEPAQPRQRVWIGGRDVSEAIRAPRISEGASLVSAHPEVRAELLERQRALGAAGCVAEGRDLGTVVFPHARHKFFITASADERARRRHADLSASVAPDPAPSMDEVRRGLDARDARDAGRAAAPLVRAPDAIELDTSDLGIDEVVALIVARVEAKTRKA